MGAELYNHQYLFFCDNLFLLQNNRIYLAIYRITEIILEDLQHIYQIIVYILSDYQISRYFHYQNNSIVEKYTGLLKAVIVSRQCYKYLVIKAFLLD